MPRPPANRRPSGLVRLIAAMVDGIDRAVNPGEEGEIKPGTPLTDWRTAALAVGCRVKTARQAMKDPAFLSDLKAAMDDARWREEPENLATLITTRDDRDMPAGVRLSAIEAIRPAEPVHSVMAKETSWRAKNQRSAARKQAQTIAASPGAIIGAPQLPAPPGRHLDGASGSIAEAEAARWEAKDANLVAGQPAQRRICRDLPTIASAFKGQFGYAYAPILPSPWPPKPRPRRYRLGDRKV